MKVVCGTIWCMTYRDKVDSELRVVAAVAQQEQ